MHATVLLTSVATLLLVSALSAGTALSGPPAHAAPTSLRVPAAHRAVVEDVARAMLDLGVALPAETTVHVYDTPAAFRRGLLGEAYVGSDRVDEIAAFAAGLARPNRVFLQSGAARGRREWTRLIAHELSHVAQFALAGGDGRADQWLAEGVAERIAFEVLERLGLDSLADRRRRALANVRQHPGFVAGRVDLVALGSPSEFTLRHQRDGSLATYQLSFLLADVLVQRAGLSAVLDYFRRCQELDRSSAFVATFGRSVQAFEAEVLGDLRAQMESH